MDEGRKERGSEELSRGLSVVLPGAQQLVGEAAVSCGPSVLSNPHLPVLRFPLISARIRSDDGALLCELPCHHIRAAMDDLQIQTVSEPCRP